MLLPCYHDSEGSCRGCSRPGPVLWAANRYPRSDMRADPWSGGCMDCIVARFALQVRDIHHRFYLRIVDAIERFPEVWVAVVVVTSDVDVDLIDDVETCRGK